MCEVVYFITVGADPVCVDSTIDYGYANGQPCALVHISKVFCVLIFDLLFLRTNIMNYLFVA